MKKQYIEGFLKKCDRRHDTPDLHSFRAKIKDGVVYVDCRGYGEVFIVTYIYGSDGKETEQQFSESIAGAAERLQELEMDFDTIDM